MAITDYGYIYIEYGKTGSKCQEPSMDIVETLLQHGATLDGDPLWHHLWRHVLENNQRRPDSLMLLLRYGADPFATQLCTPKSIAFNMGVWALAKAKREEARRNGSERRSMEKVIAVENTAPAEDKMESTKPRFRSRLLLGKGGRKHSRLTSG